MNLNKNLSRLGVAAAVAAVVCATPAHAFRMIQNTGSGWVTAGNLVTCNDPGGFVHWTVRDINWFHNTAGQGAGKAGALQAAMQSWTNVPSTSYALHYAGTTGAGFAVSDGVNALVWASGTGCTGGGCLALTGLLLQGPDQIILETDITFNPNVTWTTNGANFDTETVAAHEFGHSLGLHHSEVGGATMATPYFGSAGRSLEADDAAGLQCSENRYPVSSPVCQTCPRVALQAFNSQWWVAEGGGGGVINADRNGVGPWEEFRLVDLGGGQIALQCANGQYVVAEGGGGQQLFCNRNAIGGWEVFNRINLGGSQIALQCANGQYVVAENGGGQGVYCNRNAIGGWETFILTFL